jgi:hypothetical protein
MHTFLPQAVVSIADIGDCGAAQPHMGLGYTGCTEPLGTGWVLNLHLQINKDQPGLHIH